MAKLLIVIAIDRRMSHPLSEKKLLFAIVVNNTENHYHSKGG